MRTKLKSVNSFLANKNLWIKLGLFVLGFLVICPFVFLVGGLFMGKAELIECFLPDAKEGGKYVKWHILPMYPTLQNVVEVLFDSPEFFQMFINSSKITLGILIGQLLVGMPAAWGFARYNFPLKKLLFAIYIMIMMMPFQVFMLPQYIVLKQLSLLDTLWAIIVPGIFATLPVFLMYRFFTVIPEEIIEAGKVDGLSDMQILIKIGIPLGKPGILSSLIISFLECWSLLEQPQTFLETKSNWPLALYMAPISQENIGLSMAVAVFTILPATLFFMSGQNYLQQGIMSYASK